MGQLVDRGGTDTALSALNNVRAALEWSFGKGGDANIGIALATAAAPVLLAMSLLTECHRWSERAILALDDTGRGGLQEMHLQTALGVSLMFTRGGQDAALLALTRGLAIAEARGDPLDQVRVLGPLSMFYLRTGHFKVALRDAYRCSALARDADDEVAIELARSVLGHSLHLTGDFGSARGSLRQQSRGGGALAGHHNDLSWPRGQIFGRCGAGTDVMVTRPSRSGHGAGTPDR